ncbi:MFS transporter [Thalassotalea sp. PS06]|uniref:MFS transporter n=1 Tax=Thalassotalea sp. PS06 TaxID=2594005 RepID=UPI00116589B0|nr:MFS transporter [Thalassotalea sp. PS06]QDP01624.1 MFS transporter [Thalassotalea sp. PS06]
MNKLPGFLLSCLLAFIAGHVVNYSIIFLAIDWFDSPMLAGIGYGLCFGPPVILGWFAGVYCDRYSPRRVILIAQNSFLISLALLYVALDSTPTMQIGLLLSAAFFAGVGWSFVSPARFAALPGFIAEDKLTGGTIALNLMVMSGFGIAPMVVKNLQVSFGYEGVFVAGAIMFVVSSLLLALLRYHPESSVIKQRMEADTKPQQARNAEQQTSIWQQVVEGWQVIFRPGIVKPLLLLSMITYLLMGPMQVLLPVIAEKQLFLSEKAQGTYLSLVAFSLIIGGLISLVTRNAGKLGLQLNLCILIAAAGLGSLAIVTNLALSVIVLLTSGIAGGIAISLIVAGLNQMCEPAYRGRVMACYTIIGQVIPALSGVVFGALAQAFDAKLSLMLAGGLIVSLIVIALLRLKDVIKLESFEQQDAQKEGFEHASLSK